jgi:membrane protein implicated in regulation of membrane protease activity
MQHPMEFQFRTRSGLGVWLTILAAMALIVAIGILAATVAFGLFLILAPVILLAAVLNYFFPRAGFRQERKRHPGAPNIIDGEYRVVEPCVVEPDASRIEPPREK